MQTMPSKLTQFCYAFLAASFVFVGSATVAADIVDSAQTDGFQTASDAIEFSAASSFQFGLAGAFNSENAASNSFDYDSIELETSEITAIPEPNMMFIAGIGTLMVGLRRRRRKIIVS
ncbi:MAG: hypothetical protein ACI87E_004853 [Mariniblastus sp.]|jgi:hypothetical protein